MEVYYREVDETFETEKKFESFDLLKEYLEKQYPNKKIKIEYWNFDRWFGRGTTFAVSANDDSNKNTYLGFVHLREDDVHDYEIPFLEKKNTMEMLNLEPNRVFEMKYKGVTKSYYFDKDFNLREAYNVCENCNALIFKIKKGEAKFVSLSPLIKETFSCFVFKKNISKWEKRKNKNERRNKTMV